MYTHAVEDQPSRPMSGTTWRILCSTAFGVTPDCHDAYGRDLDSRLGNGCATEREAAEVLADALGQVQRLHEPGERRLHRERLSRAIALSSRVVAAAEREPVDASVANGARLTFVLAHRARAEDARHGAGQLSRGAQRAPTVEDCEDGWRRVEEIVATCEASAREATRVAAELGYDEARRAAQQARAAAEQARRIVDDRNHAYTFHADPSFSFGEGWYVAAAGILAGVPIQVEPDKPQTAQVERFLRDAGLGSLVVPYRPRPRANKALPDLVARAFKSDPDTSRARVRKAFLGDEPVPEVIVRWIEETLSGASKQKKVLVWVRQGAYHPTRNTDHAELVELCRRASRVGLVPVLVGDALEGEPPAGAVDMTLFWKKPLFQGSDMRRAQLQLFERMRQDHGLRGQLGVTTAGMDGPALIGLATMYLTTEPNVRLGRWVGAVPGYEEVLREEDYLDRIGRTLATWARDAPIGERRPTMSRL